MSRFEEEIFESMSVEERFWEKVDKRGEDKCWEFRGHALPDGYGTFWYKKSKIPAHRVSYIINCGDIPEGLEVCHTCNNKWCVNPKHLYTGTHYDNIKYRDEQGRTPKGENHYSALFTTEDVHKIREEYINDKKITMHELSKKYNVMRDVIENIINNKTYKDNNYTVPIYKSGKEGEHNSHAKLNWEKVNEIRKKYKNGSSYHKLAEEYSVSDENIGCIIRNVTWII